MALALEFIFLVVIPIWSAATLTIRWIEAWASETDDELISELLETSDEMSRRVKALESVVLRR
jgi:hypothetical protein